MLARKCWWVVLIALFLAASAATADEPADPTSPVVTARVMP